MVKKSQIGFRIDESEKMEMERVQKELGFSSLTVFISFLFRQFNSERKEKNVKK